ncbi:HupE/UreJ family protein [Shewanella sp. NIFS-20-20]|uniref:HupE/UreJ family protein n=1 Tax=Shewanella sp. NIFS-20-20 TaxID=2853806 RepID=UPI001C4590D9|nr:HupE/UreJ family protein [Shewanella sp. NIFS-20-20]MBV7314622.1 HupE/UreJ family protein [Shewanella sp. NIFS-20-20]
MMHKRHIELLLSGLLVLAIIPLIYLSTFTDWLGFVASGIQSPVTVVAQVLMMLAVGVWSAQLGGRALWFVPFSFTALMVVGTLFANTALSLAMANAGIMFSVVVMGALICDATRFSTLVAAAIVGVLAISHGYALGHTLAISGQFGPYLLGVVFTGLCLNLIGELSGCIFDKNQSKRLQYRLGAVILLAGIVMIVSH